MKVCSVCEKKFNVRYMRKLYQLGGNQRKDEACTKCVTKRQDAIYTEQCVGNIDTAMCGIDIVTNWKENAEVRKWMLQIVEQIFKRLDVRRDVNCKVMDGEAVSGDSPAAGGGCSRQRGRRERDCFQGRQQPDLGLGDPVGGRIDRAEPGRKPGR